VALPGASCALASADEMGEADESGSSAHRAVGDMTTVPHPPTAPANSGGNIALNAGSPPTVTVTNTIFANGGAAGNCMGMLTDGGHNLEFNPTNTCGFATAPLGTDQLADPKLDALKDNGGPTQTMALLSGSAATGNGDPTVCAAATPNGAGGADQRGDLRQTSICSIGAYEAQPQTPGPLPHPQPSVSPVINTPLPIPHPQPSVQPVTGATPLPLPPRRP
ncbi:MAG: choice-of-anchor Q domain-containing protein, partial [Thermomicrobiales bacterium]